MRSLAFALLLAACAGTVNPDPHMNRLDRINTFCNGYADTLNLLSTMRDAGNLSAGQIEEIDHAEPIATMACTADLETFSGDRLTMVLGAISTLAVILEEKQ